MKYGFKTVKTKEVPELNSKAIEMLHVKSGAKLLYIQNDDIEKSFSISFRTPPKDSTGVFHILEHSVLCGSKKFPVKEPFTNLLKTSMQTFLNAFTFDDKTMYPVASTNEKDLINLADVYLDAVFNPNLYEDVNIFYQEGGHITKDGDFNGVVYNEMQGAYSDPQEVLNYRIAQNLFPESNYKFSSGGRPNDITKLKYESYIQEHADHYQPSNAYIILYGNLNLDNMLEFLDNKYLNIWHNKLSNTPRQILNQKPIDNGFKQYEMKTSKENAVAGCAFVTNKDHFKNFATSILLQSLASTNESPLKAKLLESNIASDFEIFFYNEIKHPAVYVEAKSIKKNKAKDLVNIIEDSIKNIKIDKDILYSAISKTEFALKEKIPEFSPGIDLAVNVMSEWLYDDEASMDNLFYIDDINRAKELVNTDYYEKLMYEIFINNNHKAHVEIVATDSEEKPKQYSVTNEIIKSCDELEAKQSSKDSLENIDKLPKMSIKDIDDIKEYPKVNKTDNIRRHLVQNTDICYVNRYYDLNCLNYDELGYASLLCEVLGKLDTKNFTAYNLDNLIKTYLGNLSFMCSTYDGKTPKIKLCIKASSLKENSHKLASLIDEIIFNTVYNEKIKAIITQTKVMLEQDFINSGHLSAISRAMSYVSPAYLLKEAISGVDYYRFIKSEIDLNKLESVANKIFSQKPEISIIADDESYDLFFNVLQDKNIKHKTQLVIPKCEYKNEAFIIPSNVTYASISNNINSICKGSHTIASKIISLEYLWDEVRVKNGAYGAGMLITAKGNIQYYSYRDPNLDSTFNSFIESGKWLTNHKFRKDELEGYIISSVAKIDAPKPIKHAMIIQDNNYYYDVSDDYRNKHREEIINATLDDIANASKDIYTYAKEGAKCVFGGKELIKNSNMELIDLIC